MTTKWLSEEAWLGRIEGGESNLIEDALRDCPASVPLWLNYISLNNDPEKALNSLAIWDLERGHELWLQCKDEALLAKRATVIPYQNVAVLKEAFPNINFPCNAIDFTPTTIASCKSIQESAKLSMIRCWHERRLSSKPDSWQEYLKFLYQNLPVASVLKEVSLRFTRACPASVVSWQSFIDVLLIAKDYESVLDLKLPERVAANSSIQLSILAAQAGSKSEPINQAAQKVGSKQAALFCLSRDRDINGFRAVWKHSILKYHAKDAQCWLEYINLEQAFGANDWQSIVSSAFKQAFAAATDKNAILDAWLDFERLNNGSLLAVKTREMSAEQDSTEDSRKRPRVEEETTQPAKFDPNATLFVNNLPFDFTREQICALFPSQFTIKSLRMHLKEGKTFKGHATIEFSSPEEAAAVLASCNRKMIEGRPMFLAPYQSPLTKEIGKETAPSALTTKDPKTIYASRLPENTNMDQLEGAFSKFSGFKEVRHTPGKPFAYIEFESAGDAERVVSESITIDGHQIKLAISEPPVIRRADAQTRAKMFSLVPRSMLTKK